MLFITKEILIFKQYQAAFLLIHIAIYIYFLVIDTKRIEFMYIYVCI